MTATLYIYVITLRVAYSICPLFVPSRSSVPSPSSPVPYHLIQRCIVISLCDFFQCSMDPFLILWVLPLAPRQRYMGGWPCGCLLEVMSPGILWDRSLWDKEIKWILWKIFEIKGKKMELKSLFPQVMENDNILPGFLEILCIQIDFDSCN